MKNKSIKFFFILFALLQFTPLFANSFEPETYQMEELIPEEMISENFEYESFEEGNYEYEQLLEEELLYEYLQEEMLLVEENIPESVELQSLSVSITDGETYRAVSGNYDVDWKKVISRFSIGSSVIVFTGVATGVSAYLGAEPVAFVFVSSFKGSIKEAIIGAAVGSAIGALIGAAESGGDISAIKKYSIEGAADGFMWGAITGALTGGVKGAKSSKSPTNVKTTENVHKKDFSQVDKLDDFSAELRTSSKYSDTCYYLHESSDDVWKSGAKANLFEKPVAKTSDEIRKVLVNDIILGKKCSSCKPLIDKVTRQLGKENTGKLKELLETLLYKGKISEKNLSAFLNRFSKVLAGSNGDDILRLCASMEKDALKNAIELAANLDDDVFKALLKKYAGNVPQLLAEGDLLVKDLPPSFGTILARIMKGEYGKSLLVKPHSGGELRRLANIKGQFLEIKIDSSLKGFAYVVNSDGTIFATLSHYKGFIPVGKIPVKRYNELSNIAVRAMLK